MASYISLNTLPPQNSHNEDAAKALARVLGFDPESDKAYLPWINYIRGHRLSKEKPEKDFLQLCQDVISRFTGVFPYSHLSVLDHEFDDRTSFGKTMRAILTQARYKSIFTRWSPIMITSISVTSRLRVIRERRPSTAPSC